MSRDQRRFFATVRIVGGDLSRLVSESAQRLGVAAADDAVTVSEQVLTDIAEHFGLDVAFLRHNDHAIRATVLVAQWPIRADIPDPDPIGTVFFDGADPIFAMAEHLKEPRIVRPGADDDYQRRIEEGTSVPVITMAAVPLLTSGGVTSGTLGFIKFGDQQWTAEQLDGLQTIATLFAYLKDRLEADAALQWHATHDDLTGLANRRTLLAHVDEQLAGGRPGPVAVLSMDLDRLQSINALLGQTARDTALAVFADRLREQLGEAAFLGRLAGGSVVAVLNGPTSARDASAVADRIRPALEACFDLPSGPVKSRVSIGVAVGIPGEDSTSELISHAEHALGVAHELGGGETVVFTDALAEAQALRTDIEVHLLDALDGDELTLQYQPEVDLQTGAVVAIAAQLRWHHPTRGVLHPATFVPVAESINVAAALDRHSLQLACGQLRAWHREGLATDIVLRVKVSPVVTVTEGFVEYVASTLAQFHIGPESLSLEFAESITVEEAAASRETLHNLKSIGVGLVLDQFGTGYSDLAGLKSLPIDTVKIAPVFVAGADSSGGDIAIIRSVVGLADAFGLAVVADGVQTPAAAELLVREGCRRAQGPLLCPPLDATAMHTVLVSPFVQAPTSRRGRPA